MAAKKKPVFDYDVCVGCAICFMQCPVSALSMTKLGVDDLNTPFPELGERDWIGCGSCEKVCPMQAIKMQLV